MHGAREPLPLVGRGSGGGRKVEANSPEDRPIRSYKQPCTQPSAPHPPPFPARGKGEAHLSTASTPHHSATKSAMVPVMRFSDARLTRSSKAWMFCEIGP